MPYCNTVCMNLFLRELTNQFPDDIVLHCCDGAVWHQSNMLDIPENIVLFTFRPIHWKNRDPRRRMSRNLQRPRRTRPSLPYPRTKMLQITLMK